MILQAGYLPADLLTGGVDPGRYAETIRWTFPLSTVPPASAVDR
jgi:hypothetical protein